MRLSIRQVLAPMALLVTALVSMGMAPVDPAPLSPATPSTCSSYIDWNAEKGVWRINCGDSASCCEYETVRKLDGVAIHNFECFRTIQAAQRCLLSKDIAMESVALFHGRALVGLSS
jgi:hypothetical protein